MSQTFLLEPDIIAATENVMPSLTDDLVLAKNYLKAQCAATGDTLYDHLVDVVHKMLTHKPPEVVDNFEQYSWEVKQEKFRPNFDFLNEVYLAPEQLELVKKLSEMIKGVRGNAPKLEALDEEEPELDLEEENQKANVPDIIDNNYYFKQAGYGLPDSECYTMYVALKMLANKEPISTVRFFGIIYGLKANYYVAETDLTIEELDRRIREFELKDMPGEGEDMGEERNIPQTSELAVAEEKGEMLGEGEMKEEKPKERVPPPLPPIPLSTWKAPIPTPVERPGQGVNKKVFWVCNYPGDEWICLPDVTPQQIDVTRKTVRCMTGDLDTEILTYPPFEGTERNYLRAQIARIAAATAISPQGFYTFGSGEEEEDIDLEEGGIGNMDFNVNPYYQGHTLKDLLDSNFTYWVHHGRHILRQGRTIWWNPNAGMDEAMEEEEDEGMPHMEPETGPSLMSPLSEDSKVEGMPLWTARSSSAVAPDRALAVLRSNLWPGGVAFATTGKKSECMYVGWGLKYEAHNYSPPLLPPVWDEYPLGPEIMEIPDPTFAEEEAYRIAHLPPPPPPEFPGEGGEGLPEEEEEEEDEE